MYTFKSLSDFGKNFKQTVIIEESKHSRRIITFIPSNIVLNFNNNIDITFTTICKYEKDKTKFYTYNQNNSGGHRIKNKELGIDEFIIIEAYDEDHAGDIFEKIAEKKDGFYEECECCGPRWEAFEIEEYCEPKIYDIPVSLSKYGCYVHFLDGNIKAFNIKD